MLWYFYVLSKYNCVLDIIKKLGASYVYWYNDKYRRIGHLFQDRFKSEPIEDNDYLLTVVRYIHQNPVKVGLSIDNWTSYDDYLGDGSRMDIAPILALMGSETEAARTEFLKFVNEPNNDTCMEISERKKITDEEAKAMIRSMGLEACQDLQLIDKGRRDAILKSVKGKGMSVRQLERITGVNRGVILRA